MKSMFYGLGLWLIEKLVKDQTKKDVMKYEFSKWMTDSAPKSPGSGLETPLYQDQIKIIGGREADRVSKPSEFEAEKPKKSVNETVKQAVHAYLSPFAIAERERSKGVKEISGSRHNPRVLLYHLCVNGAISDDETPWCSSFMNYCVIMSNLTKNPAKQYKSMVKGLAKAKVEKIIEAFQKEFWPLDLSHDTGIDIVEPTYNAAAISWEHHGQKTTKYVQGAIMVKYRTTRSDWRRHVTFVESENGSMVRCLGGNQGDSVNITSFAKSTISWMGIV